MILVKYTVLSTDLDLAIHFTIKTSDLEPRAALDVAEGGRPVAAPVVVPRVLVGPHLNAVLQRSAVGLARVERVEAARRLVHLLARVRIDVPPLRQLVCPSRPETNCETVFSLALMSHYVEYVRT